MTREERVGEIRRRLLLLELGAVKEDAVGLGSGDSKDDVESKGKLRSVQGGRRGDRRAWRL